MCDGAEPSPQARTFLGVLRPRLIRLSSSDHSVQCPDFRRPPRSAALISNNAAWTRSGSRRFLREEDRTAGRNSSSHASTEETAGAAKKHALIKQPLQSCLPGTPPPRAETQGSLVEEQTMSRISRASRGSSDSLLASQRPPVDRVKLRGLKRRALTYDARLEALAREVKETEALLRIEQNKRDARLHAAERARKGEHDSAAIVRESSEKVPRWLATLGELHGEVQESVVESKARCDELCEGQEESLQRSFATRIKHAYKEVEAMRKARNERCLGWIDRSEEGERDLAWSRDTLDLYKKQAEKLASINKVVRERAAKACKARKELIAELVAEKQKRDQLQQRLRELNADTFEAAEAPAPAAEEEAVPSPEVLTLQAEIRGAKRKLVKARSDYNQDFQEQAELRSLLDAFDRGLRARLDDALKATTRPRTVGRTAKAASSVTRAQSAAASPGSRRPKVGDEIRLQLKVVAQLRELTFPPPPDLLEAARRPGPRRRSPVMKKPQPPLGRRPATGKAPTASTSLRDTRRPETAGAISRPLLASMLATRTTKYL